LSDLDLDVAVGTGGALAGGVDFGGAKALEEVAIFDLADLDQRPQPIAPVAPSHPPELLKARVEGSVVVLFVLDENGRVQDPRVEYSSRPEFERPALDAISKWRFKPGTREGKSVRSYVRQQIAFKIAH
jgi:protein TonB